MTLHIGWPQFIWVVLAVFSLSWDAYHHGMERPRYHAGTSFVAMILAFLLLYWGGFFK